MFTPLVPLTLEHAAPSQSAARAASALAAAETTHTTAQSAFDTAQHELAATLADHDAAATRVAEVRALADTAATRAELSSSTLAALVRAMLQRGSDTTALDAVLGSQDASDLLTRLGIVDRLASLTGNLDKIREQVERDEKRSDSLQAKLTVAQDAAASFPVGAKQAALATAESALNQATAALAAAHQAADAELSDSAGAAVETSTPAASQVPGLIGARLSNQGWAAPALGTINDVFGARPDLPLPGAQPFHAGTDVGAACGSPVYAASAGNVVQTGQLGTYGNWILIDHGDGVATGYAHILDGATLVKPGDAVIAGQVIAGVGSTGLSTGCHLHIEVRINGTAVDPQTFFAAQGITLGAG